MQDTTFYQLINNNKDYSMFYFSESTSLYLFSALLQANAAIFALYGLFIVYKMQSHKASIDIIKTALYNIHQKPAEYSKVLEFEAIKSDKKANYYEKMDKKSDDNKFYETWAHHIKRIIILRTKIYLPTILLTLGMCFSGVMLFIASNLHEYHPISEVIVSFIALCYHMIVYSFLSIRLILIVING